MFSPFILQSGLVFEDVWWILNEEIAGLRDQQLKRKVVGNLREETVNERHFTDARQHVLLTIQHNLQTETRRGNHR